MRYFPIFLGIGILLTLAADSLWLDYAGYLAPGTVALKRELVAIDHSTWSRQFLLRVVYHGANTRPSMTDLAVNEREFDSLHIGDPIKVRYLDLRIIPGVRLATRGTGTIIADFFRKLPWPESSEIAHPLKADARIVETRAGDPYTLVHVVFSPEGYRDPVQAVVKTDGISPAAGGHIRIEYDPQSPRHVRLEHAHS